jgi:RsiW-degrading membrane proteinase PrsW (M82 family)
LTALHLAAALVLGAAPSLFLLVFFYLKDRYEPEPRGHVALSFLLGALALAAALGGQVALERIVGREWLALGGIAARLFEAGVMAAAIEELAKWLVFLVVIYRWREFDEPLDGVVYGVALALGFATVENVLCVLRDGLAVGVLRALFAVPAHALFGAAMGFYLGRAKLGRGRFQEGPITTGERARRLALALLLPSLFHGFYDFALVELSGAWLYVVVAALSLALWIFILRRVRQAQGESPFGSG